MEKFLRNVAIAACLITIGQNAAKAQDFSVTTQPNYMGGYTTTYRQIAPLAAGGAAVQVLDLSRVAILPNACDAAGRPAFEIVTRAPGERQCVGAR